MAITWLVPVSYKGGLASPWEMADFLAFQTQPPPETIHGLGSILLYPVRKIL